MGMDLGMGSRGAGPALALVPSRIRTQVMPASRVSERGSAWEGRLYGGLRVGRVPPEIRADLTSALGDLGVEAEYFLTLLANFPGAPQYSHARGQAFLLQLEAACHRLLAVAGTLEIATQGYLGALEATYSELRGDQEGDGWWPPFAGYTLPGEALELRLRRCSYAYRHVVTAHLTANIEPVAEHLALVLHALTTLPPAGVLPASSLHQGLYELSSTLQGYVVSHHLVGVDEQTPGLLMGIAWLRGLDAYEDTSLESDIAWAHAQYAFARGVVASNGLPEKPNGPRYAWVARALQDWQDTIAALERLRAAR